jgi:hypothetical protein
MKKVKLNWARLTVPNKIIRARNVVQTMGRNSDTYPAPTPSLREIARKTDQLEVAEARTRKGGTDRTVRRDARLEELSQMMATLVDYVQLASGGDEELILRAGMEVRRDSVRWPVPGRVQNLQAVPGGNPGSIGLTWKAVRYRRVYVIEMWEDGLLPPRPAQQDAVPADTPERGGRWTQIASLGKLRYTVTGLTSGRTYRFRAAAVNSHGMGTYSEDITCVAR